MYYFLDKKQTETGDHLSSFLTIIAFSQADHYLLCRLPADVPALSSLRPVSQALYALLISAEHYPPALALTQAYFERQLFTSNSQIATPTLETFDHQIQQVLCEHLKHQPYARYVLAEAIVDEPGYLMRGVYYWIIGYDPHNCTVHWIADDYIIYQNSCDNFDLAAVNLDNLAIELRKIEDRA
ncbi:MAG: hypothetical protein IPO81_25450 [Kouleothrix sp.]|nr:hypothetical protein [Kouleothrix sp.]